jgi:hypothetical protein
MQVRQHLLMQNARYRNATCADAVKNYMPAAFHTAQAWANIFTRTAYCGRLRKLVAERP